MRILEILVENQISQPSEKFVQAVSDWQEMWQPNQAAKIILASPESKPFMRPPSLGKIYRAVKTPNKPSRGSVMAYSQSKQGAVNFAYSFAVSGRWYLLEKDFNPADFLLDFTAMIQHYKMVGDRDENEYEVWMKPTPYYTTGTKEEVVATFLS